MSPLDLYYNVLESQLTRNYVYGNYIVGTVPDNIQGIAGGLAEKAGHGPGSQSLYRVGRPVTASFSLHGRRLHHASPLLYDGVEDPDISFPC
jgi:hypothetical protein